VKRNPGSMPSNLTIGESHSHASNTCLDHFMVGGASPKYLTVCLTA
jgi:hypothetical protein